MPAASSAVGGVGEAPGVSAVVGELGGVLRGFASSVRRGISGLSDDAPAVRLQPAVMPKTEDARQEPTSVTAVDIGEDAGEHVEEEEEEEEEKKKEQEEEEEEEEEEEIVQDTGDVVSSSGDGGPEPIQVTPHEVSLDKSADMVLLQDEPESEVDVAERHEEEDVEEEKSQLGEEEELVEEDDAGELQEATPHGKEVMQESELEGEEERAEVAVEEEEEATAEEEEEEEEDIGRAADADGVETVTGDGSVGEASMGEDAVRGIGKVQQREQGQGGTGDEEVREDGVGESKRSASAGLDCMDEVVGQIDSMHVSRSTAEQARAAKEHSTTDELAVDADEGDAEVHASLSQAQEEMSVEVASGEGSDEEEEVAPSIDQVSADAERSEPEQPGGHSPALAKLEAMPGNIKQASEPGMQLPGAAEGEGEQMPGEAAGPAQGDAFEDVLETRAVGDTADVDEESALLRAEVARLRLPDALYRLKIEEAWCRDLQQDEDAYMALCAGAGGKAGEVSLRRALSERQRYMTSHKLIAVVPPATRNGNGHSGGTGRALESMYVALAQALIGANVDVDGSVGVAGWRRLWQSCEKEGGREEAVVGEEERGKGEGEEEEQRKEGHGKESTVGRARERAFMARLGECVQKRLVETAHELGASPQCPMPVCERECARACTLACC